jgi:hypothetical protein
MRALYAIPPQLVKSFPSAWGRLPFGEIGIGRWRGGSLRIARDSVATCEPPFKIRQATACGTKWSVRIFSPGRAPSTRRAADRTSILAHEDALTAVARSCWRVSSFALMSSSIIALAWRCTFSLRRLRTTRPATVFTPGISGSLTAAGCS